MKKILAVVFALILVSCDLVTTRTPEEPKSLSSDFVPATTPDILFSNLKLAFKEEAVEYYLTCLVDTSFLSRKFVFTPSIGSVSQYSILNNWGMDGERQYFQNLSSVSVGTGADLTLSNETKTLYGDSAIYQYDYSIAFKSGDATIPSEYKGSTQFKIFLDSQNRWVIAEWLDAKKENFFSWSELKGRLY